MELHKKGIVSMIELNNKDGKIIKNWEIVELLIFKG